LNNLQPEILDTTLPTESPLASVQKEYFKAITKLVGDFSGIATSHLAFVYTPMHGVGLKFMRQAAQNGNILNRMRVCAIQVSFQYCSLDDVFSDYRATRTVPSSFVFKSKHSKRRNQILTSQPSNFQIRKKKAHWMKLLSWQKKKA
jgi:hypothetical protein